jgi:hypothetical protein
MEERGKVVCMAKLAEQAERYDGTVPSLGLVAPCSCCVQCVSSWRSAFRVDRWYSLAEIWGFLVHVPAGMVCPAITCSIYLVP